MVSAVTAILNFFITCLLFRLLERFWFLLAKSEKTRASRLLIPNFYEECAFCIFEKKSPDDT